jgi:hypothetical protein
VIDVHCVTPQGAIKATGKEDGFTRWRMNHYNTLQVRNESTAAKQISLLVYGH